MPTPEVLAIVQAGGHGSRMDVLTRERAKPALPVLGVYQLLDLAMSNLANSGVSDVWLSVQYQATALEDQVANGRPWDLDRTRGGLRLLLPDEGTGTADDDGFARGNADELFRIRDQIRSADPEVVVVMSADHVYRLDVRELVREHRSRDLECTLVTTEVEAEEAGDHAVLVVRDGLVVEVEEKPDDPQGRTVSAEIVAYRPDVLIEVLEQLHRELGPDAGPGDTGLGDVAEHLLPRLASRGRTGAFALDGYWRDLGQPHHYLRAHRELLLDDQGVFDDPDWPIRTRHPQRRPARVLAGAEVADSLLSSGCVVAGRVERSVIGPGVRVEAGASVVDSVVLDGVTIASGARVARAIVDQRSTIGAGARVGGPDADLADSSQITLVGRDSRVPDGADIVAGARLEPGSSGA